MDASFSVTRCDTSPIFRRSSPAQPNLPEHTLSSLTRFSLLTHIPLTLKEFPHAHPHLALVLPCRQLLHPHCPAQPPAALGAGAAVQPAGASGCAHGLRDGRLCGLGQRHPVGQRRHHRLRPILLSQRASSQTSRYPPGRSPAPPAPAAPAAPSAPRPDLPAPTPRPPGSPRP